MKLIIDIDEELYGKIGKSTEEWASRYVEGWQKTIAEVIANGTPYNPTGDAISREALKRMACVKFYTSPYYKHILDLIDNAPPVDIKDQIAGAYNEGYMCGSREAEKARPQGEYVDISKLRLMTVEECAGHTIEYAMGWKACIEWLKKGGAE